MTTCVVAGAGFDKWGYDDAYDEPLRAQPDDDAANGASSDEAVRGLWGGYRGAGWDRTSEPPTQQGIFYDGDGSCGFFSRACWSGCAWL